MTEEVQIEKQPEQPVQISEQEVDQINQEIEKVEDSKLQAAKEEGASIGKDLAALKAELDAIKAENAAKEAARKEAEERARLEAEIAAEKAKAEEPVRKATIPSSANPVIPNKVPEARELPPLTKEEEWMLFDEAFKTPKSASLKPQDLKNLNN